MKLHLSVANSFSKDFIVQISEQELLKNNRFILFPTKQPHSHRDLKEVKEAKFIFGLVACSRVLKLPKGSSLFLHSLEYKYFFPTLIASLRGFKIYWLFYGGEFYGTFNIENNLLKTQTIKSTKSSIHIRLKKLSRHFRAKVYGRLVSKIDYLGHFNSYESDIVIDFFKRKSYKIKPVHFQYPRFATNIKDLAEVRSQLQEKKAKRPTKLMIGNSAAIHQNHFDVIDMVSSLHNCHFGFVLSYGGYPDYIKQIKDKAFTSLGEKNVSLHENYLSYKGFIELLADYDALVYYSKRSAGLGTIVIALYLGLKVFVDKDVPTYSLLKSYNFDIYDVNKDLVNIHTCNPKEENKDLVEKYFGMEKIQEYYTNLFS